MSRKTVRVPSNYASLPQEKLVSIIGNLLEVMVVLKDENKELTKKLKELNKENKELKRTAKRFSKGKKPGKHKKPGRKKGKGPFTNRKPPDEADVTEKVPVPAPDTCPDCGESDFEMVWEDAFTTEIPKPKPRVVHYRRAACHCRRCHHRWRAPHPDLADDQYGATAHRLGPRLRATAQMLHYSVGVPVRKVPSILRELQGVKVTQSALTQDALRTAKAGAVRERFEEIQGSLAEAPVVHVDPTSWRKAGKLVSLIVFATPDRPEEPGKTLYLVREQHRSDEIIEVLGDDFPGVMVSDRGPEFDAKKLAHYAKQKCNTHIKRNVGDALENKIGIARRFGEGLRSLLDEARQLRRDYDAGQRQGYDEKVADLDNRLTHHLRVRKLTDADNVRMLEQIGWQHDQGNLVRFLYDTNVSPDNHLAEREVRPAVIARKVSHCSKNDAGADAHATYSTVFRTESRAIGHNQEKTPPSLIDRIVGLFKPNRRVSSDTDPSLARAPPHPNQN